MSLNIFFKAKKIIIFLTFNIIAVVILFLVLEGLSSSIFIIHNLTNRKPLAERLHTTYDEKLGWINMPNLDLKDMYGPGVYLKTNSHSFRANNNYSKNVPANKTRIICSGDSFTFGYGVDNDHTWCQLLVSIDERLETVNMGQGGYGVDQAYLWYKRDSRNFEYDIHVFAFIHTGFERMRRDQFIGYGKPILSLQDGNLLTKNVPVPKRPYYLPWLTDDLRVIEQLKLVKLTRKLYRQKKVDNFASYVIEDENQMKEIISAMFRDLKQINQGKNSICVLLYLPVRTDYDYIETNWKQFLRGEALNNELLFIDLIDEFQKLPPHNIDKFFIPRGAIDYVASAGHYTEEGNKYIANALYKKLIAIPEISKKINKGQPRSNGTIN